VVLLFVTFLRRSSQYMSLGRMELVLRGADLDLINRIRSGSVPTPPAMPEFGWKDAGSGALFEQDRVAQFAPELPVAEGAVALGGVGVEMPQIRQF
jgi:hypothetical protein